MHNLATAWRRLGCAGIALAVSGCISLPARVAEELRAPDERAPDHYRLPDDTHATGAVHRERS